MKKIMNSPIKNPRVTEKATGLGAKGVYVFEIPKGVNKTEIEKSIFAEHKVRPLRVNILNTPKSRKAYVYLKEGDKIEL